MVVFGTLGVCGSGRNDRRIFEYCAPAFAQRSWSEGCVGSVSEAIALSSLFPRLWPCPMLGWDPKEDVVEDTVLVRLGAKELDERE